MLPESARSSLRARAQLVDDVCAEFLHRWQEDIWNSAEVAIGLAHLNCLWQRSGRIADPLTPRHCVAVVVPPGSGEMIGAVVNADLLRAAQMTVRTVIEPTKEAALVALSRPGLDAVLVAGPRVGLTGDAERTSDFADAARKRYPRLPIHTGGRAAGLLSDWPDRLALRRDDTARLPARNVEWLALSALGTLVRKRRQVSNKASRH
jgi:hypothetical protein